MVSQSFKVGDLTRGLYLSEAREAPSGSTSKALTVGVTPDFAYSQYSEYGESKFRVKDDKQ